MSLEYNFTTSLSGTHNLGNRSAGLAAGISHPGRYHPVGQPDYFLRRARKEDCHIKRGITDRPDPRRDHHLSRPSNHFDNAAAGDNRKVIVAAARAAPTSLFGNFIELGLSRTIVLERNAVDAKAELNGRVLRSFPAPDVAFRQSALLAIQGDIAAAKRMWDVAASAYPDQSASAATALAARLAAGEATLEPLVEYAASRIGASRND